MWLAGGIIPDSLIAIERWIVTHSWSTVLRIPSEALLNLEVTGGSLVPRPSITANGVEVALAVIEGLGTRLWYRGCKSHSRYSKPPITKPVVSCPAPT